MKNKICNDFDKFVNHNSSSLFWHVTGCFSWHPSSAYSRFFRRYQRSIYEYRGAMLDVYRRKRGTQTKETQTGTPFWRVVTCQLCALVVCPIHTQDVILDIQTCGLCLVGHGCKEGTILVSRTGFDVVCRLSFCTLVISRRKQSK
jgi:hypothetical protein